MRLAIHNYQDQIFCKKSFEDLESPEVLSTFVISLDCLYRVTDTDPWQDSFFRVGIFAKHTLIVYGSEAFIYNSRM